MQGPYRIEEGMEVVAASGGRIGKVGKVVVGTRTREPRFFTIETGVLFGKERLVPREALTRVDVAGAAHLALREEHVEELPTYDGDPPTPEEARQAYEALRAAAAAPEPHRRGRSHNLLEPAYAPDHEPLLVASPEDREAQGYRTEWTYGPIPDDHDLPPQ